MKTPLLFGLSILLLAGIATLGIAEEPLPDHQVKLRFRSSDPGPPINGICVDDIIAIPLTDTRRFILKVHVQGPGKAGGQAAKKKPATPRKEKPSNFRPCCQSSWCHTT